MSHINTGIRSTLEHSFIYNSFQKWVGRDRAFQLFSDRFLKLEEGCRVLDIGCGTGTMLNFLREGLEFTGFDMNPDYIQHAKSKYGHRGKFLVARLGDNHPAFESSFDVVYAYGLLHHLDEEISELLFTEAYNNLVPGGKFITMDPVFVPNASGFSNWLISKDRGQNVRNPEGYMALAKTHFPKVEGEVVHNALRIPYKHYAMVCIKSQSISNESHS